METKQLQYFCTVAEVGSFTRGARREGIPQPSLSRQIIKLEQELGTRLLDRLGRKTLLTDSGRAFLPVAKSILNQISEAKSEMQGRTDLTRASITVGAIPTVAPYILPSVLNSFRRRYPASQIRVVEEVQMRLLGALHDGVVDFALLQTPVPGKEFVVEESIREPLYAVVPENHRLASRKTIGLAQLRDEAFLVLREGFRFRKTVLDALRRARVRPIIVFEALSFSAILAMVAAGLGVSVLPEMALLTKRGHHFIPLEKSAGSYQVGVVRRRTHHLSRVHWVFMEYLKRGLRSRPHHPPKVP